MKSIIVWLLLFSILTCLCSSSVASIQYLKHLKQQKALIISKINQERKWIAKKKKNLVHLIAKKKRFQYGVAEYVHVCENLRSIHKELIKDGPNPCQQKMFNNMYYNPYCVHKPKKPKKSPTPKESHGPYPKQSIVPIDPIKSTYNHPIESNIPNEPYESPSPTPIQSQQYHYPLKSTKPKPKDSKAPNGPYVSPSIPIPKHSISNGETDAPYPTNSVNPKVSTSEGNSNPSPKISKYTIENPILSQSPVPINSITGKPNKKPLNSEYPKPSVSLEKIEPSKSTGSVTPKISNPKKTNPSGKVSQTPKESSTSQNGPPVKDPPSINTPKDSEMTTPSIGHRVSSTCFFLLFSAFFVLFI
eukprot:gene1722-491_t